MCVISTCISFPLLLWYDVLYAITYYYIYWLRIWMEEKLNVQCASRFGCFLFKRIHLICLSAAARCLSTSPLNGTWFTALPPGRGSCSIEQFQSVLNYETLSPQQFHPHAPHDFIGFDIDHLEWSGGGVSSKLQIKLSREEYTARTCWCSTR